MKKPSEVERVARKLVRLATCGAMTPDATVMRIYKEDVAGWNAAARWHLREVRRARRLENAIEWACGAKAIRGEWFGDNEPADGRPRYWWRAGLRKHAGLDKTRRSR